jgi:hypothetical protein
MFGFPRGLVRQFGQLTGDSAHRRLGIVLACRGPQLQLRTDLVRPPPG